jgi:hypothetical protein
MPRGLFRTELGCGHLNFLEPDGRVADFVAFGVSDRWSVAPIDAVTLERIDAAVNR